MDLNDWGNRTAIGVCLFGWLLVSSVVRGVLDARKAGRDRETKLLEELVRRARTLERLECQKKALELAKRLQAREAWVESRVALQLPAELGVELVLPGVKLTTTSRGDA